MKKKPNSIAIALLMLKTRSLYQMPFKIVEHYQKTPDEWKKELVGEKSEELLIAVEDSHKLIYGSIQYSEENFFGTFKDLIPSGDALFKNACKSLPNPTLFEKVYYFKDITEIKRSKNKKEFYVHCDLHFDAVRIAKAQSLYQNLKQYQGFINDGYEFTSLAFEQVKKGYQHLNFASIVHGFIDREMIQ